MNELMTQVRKRLVLDRPWWGALALRLQIKENKQITTTCVDGITMQYNPSWFESLTDEEQDAVVAHEVNHCVLEHMLRLGHRDIKLANISMDHVINLDLKAAGFRLPEPHYADPKFSHMAWEAVYATLKEEQDQKEEEEEPKEGSRTPENTDEDGPKGAPKPKGGGKGGDKGEEAPGGEGEGSGNPTDGEPTGEGEQPSEGAPGGSSDPNNWGGVISAPNVDDVDTLAGKEKIEELSREWERAAEAASMIASKAGYAPAGVIQTVRSAREPKPDITEVLQRYLFAKKNYSYASPDRRMLPHGIKMPGKVRSALENVVFAVDTSGSTMSLREYFAEKVNEVLSMDNPPEPITIIFLYN